MRRRLACSIALAALAVSGSFAAAAPAHHGKVVAKAATKAKHKAKPAPAEIEMDGDDDAAPAPAPKRRVTAHAKPRFQEQAADADDEDDDDDADPAHTDRVTPDLVAVAQRHEQDTANAWHVALGPYAWASLVNAGVSIGGQTVDPSGVKLAKLDDSIKYGGEVVGEVRYNRFSLAGDAIFGAIGIDAATNAASLMVNIHGDVSALLTDGLAGVRVVGDDHSLVAIEARGGIRYTRVAVRAAVGVDGATIAPPQIVFAGEDFLAGGRIFVRPTHRFFFTGAADFRVAGTSQSTWSVSADASMHIGQHMQLSLGWRTLALDKTTVNLSFYGPRLTFQVLI